MKNTKIRNICKKAATKAQRIKNVAITSAGAIALSTSSVFALPSENVDADKTFTSIISVLLNITRYIGIGLAIFGVIQIIMSFKNDNPDEKTRGITLAGIGIVLIGLKTLLQTIGLI